MKFKRQFGEGRYDVYNNDGVRVGEVWKYYRYGFNYWKNSMNGYGLDGKLYCTRKEASEHLIKNYNN